SGAALRGRIRLRGTRAPIAPSAPSFPRERRYACGGRRSGLGIRAGTRKHRSRFRWGTSSRGGGAMRIVRRVLTHRMQPCERSRQSPVVTKPLEDRSMADQYRIFGAEVSPYSVKVRSWFRFKGIPHQWILRGGSSQAEYQKYAKLPIIPLVVTPSNEGFQDSTPIIERLEALHPEPSIHPSDPAARFVSILLEEFGDEWGNKWMFHYRWAREVDQLSAAGRIARMTMPDADDDRIATATAQVRERMVGRVWFVGSNPQTAPQIEQSFLDTIALLEPHLS